MHVAGAGDRNASVQRGLLQHGADGLVAGALSGGAAGEQGRGVACVLVAPLDQQRANQAACMGRQSLAAFAAGLVLR